MKENTTVISTSVFEDSDMDGQSTPAPAGVVGGLDVFGLAASLFPTKALFRRLVDGLGTLVKDHSDSPECTDNIAICLAIARELQRRRGQ